MNVNDKALKLPSGGVGSGVALRQKVAVTVPGREYSPQEIEIIKATVMPPSATDFEVAQFLTICSTVKLDPFSRQIYAIRRKGRLIPQTGIDGYVTLAQRTGRYAGRSLPEWTPRPGQADRPDQCLVWVSDTRGGKAPGLALWSEHSPGDIGAREAFMWRTRPFEQLEKCAFAKALRALFGAETFGGVLVEDEVTDPAQTIQPFHVKHAPPHQEPQEARDGPIEVKAHEVASAPIGASTPADGRAEEQRVADGEAAVADWLDAIRQCDSFEVLQDWKGEIARQVEAGAYAIEQVTALREAIARAQRSLR